MNHLRLSPNENKTFCRIAVNAHPSTPVEDQTVVDPLRANCVACLNHAVEFHKMHAKLADNRMRALIKDWDRAATRAEMEAKQHNDRAAVRAAHHDATWPAGWIRPEDETKP